MAFDKRKTENETTENKTLPMPITCDSCGFELPENAESNSGYFVNFLVCRDMNRQNKQIIGMPSQFLKLTEKGRGEGKLSGSSAGGYVLKENYNFVAWVVWCVRCHSNKLKLQDMNRKTNNLTAVGNKSSLSLKQSVKKLSEKQRMR